MLPERLSCQGAVSSPGEPVDRVAYDVVLKQVDPQRVVSIHEVIPTYSDMGRLFVEIGAHLSQQRARAIGPSMTIYYDTEYRERDIDVETATPVDAAVPGNDRVRRRELPGVKTMACVLHQGPYDGLGQAYNALLGWIQANGYRIVGPNREVYLRCPDNGYDDPTVWSGYIAQDPADFLAEIQFPVEKA